MKPAHRYWCVLILAAAPAAPAAAQTTIIDTQGFRDYALGSLTGQAGGVGPGPWLESQAGAAVSSSTATVQSAVYHPYPPTGGGVNTKAVRVDRAADQDARWAIPVSAFPQSGKDLIVVQWDMRVNETLTPTAFGPFFGVQAYDSGGTLRLLGSVGVDAATGEILYQGDRQYDNQLLVASDGVNAYTASFGQWHQVQLALDYTNQAYQVVFDNRLVVSEPFADGAITGFTDADISALAVGGDPASQAARATAYFDNFIVVNLQRVPGDYNTDGHVDAGDYEVWRTSYGSTLIAGTGADGNGDGRVDAADYTVWRDHLGGPLAGALGALAPEPSAAWLTLCVLFGAGRLRRGR